MKWHLAAALALAEASLGAPQWCEYKERLLPCEVVDGQAVVEKDIVLGPAEPAAGKTGVSWQVRAIVRSGEQARWPQGVMPYEIDPEIPRPERVAEAIEHWNGRTPMRLVPRSGEADYVWFRRFNNSGICTSAVGRTGGRQTISVDDGCSLRTLIHEIGHAAGFYHEQSRYDRDRFIEVVYDNIVPERQGQFDFPLAGDLVGDYDFASVMHYSGFAFSQGGPTIVTIPAGIPIGSGSGLSAGDLDALERFYAGGPVAVRVSTNPEGLEIIVDGQRRRSPQTFQWAAGSLHTIEAPPSQPADRDIERWDFGRWSDDGSRLHEVLAGGERTFFTANYRRMRRVEARPEDPAAGTVHVEPGSPDGFYADGTEILIRAEPAAGRTFLACQLGGRQTHGLALNPVQTRASTLLSYTARFTSLPVATIASEPPGFMVGVDGAEYMAPHNFLWRAGDAHRLEPLPPDPRGEPAIRYRLEGWAGGGPLVRDIVAGETAATYTAVYHAQARLTVLDANRNPNPVTVTPASPDGYWDLGEKLLLRPNTGATPFSHWTGDYAGTANPLEYTLIGPASLLTNFIAPGVLTHNSVLHGATLTVTPLPPGGIFTLFGVEIGPSEAAHGRVDPATGRLPTVLSGTRVLVGGIAAPLLYVSARQINAVAPFSIAGERGVAVEVEFEGRRIAGAVVPVAPASPGIFTLNGSGRGPAAVLNEDYSLNTPENPAPRNSVVMVWAAGLGETEPPGVDGKLTEGILPLPVAEILARVGNRVARVEHASAAPGFVAGVFQVNIRIPGDSPVGEAVPLELRAGTVRSQQPVTLAVR